MLLLQFPVARILRIFCLYFAGIETKFAGSSCNDLVTADGAGTTIISAHFDKRIRFWDTRSETSANDIVLNGKVTSLDLSRGNNFRNVSVTLPSNKLLYNLFYFFSFVLFILFCFIYLFSLLLQQNKLPDRIEPVISKLPPFI